MKKSRTVLCAGVIAFIFLFTQCEFDQFGRDQRISSVDEDSDRPAWAGGNTEDNIHRKGNSDSGTPRGTDYGDLYKLLRNENGVPIMWQASTLEWYVQPIDDQGEPLDLNAEGELIDPTLATEVEFGRLNIVRAPQSVLDQAFAESMKVLKAPGAVISLDFCGRLTSTYPDPVTLETIVKTIDSPRENMALYQCIMEEMFTDRLAFLEVYGFDPLTVAASCFAAGSDKTGTVDIDEVVYINGFLQCTGLNPILNEYEFEYYYNFGEPMLGDAKFQYSREQYADRYLRIISLNGDGTYNEEIKSVLAAMEDGGLFTYVWGEVDDDFVSGFALAVDDAVQVLDYVHGDSNIEFLPDYTP